MCSRVNALIAVLCSMVIGACGTSVHHVAGSQSITIVSQVKPQPNPLTQCVKRAHREHRALDDIRDVIAACPPAARP
jgi:hypothetical protein